MVTITGRSSLEVENTLVQSFEYFMDLAPSLACTNCTEHPHSSLILYQLYRYVTQPSMVVRPGFHTLSQINLLYKYFESIAVYDRLVFYLLPV